MREETERRNLISNLFMPTSKLIKRRRFSSDVIQQVARNQMRWRTQPELQIYYSKLVQALRHVLRNEDSPATPRAVRVAADRILAVAAKGRTRWSRAIISSQLRMKMRRINAKHKRSENPKAIRNVRSNKPAPSKKKASALQGKQRVLGRLIPGCHKLSFPNLITEATDYISALEMQVRAMATLAGLLTGVRSDPESSTPDQLRANPT